MPTAAWWEARCLRADWAHAAVACVGESTAARVPRKARKQKQGIFEREKEPRKARGTRKALAERAGLAGCLPLRSLS